MSWSVFGKAFLCETVYAIPFFILSILPFKKQLRFPVKILILFIFIGQLLQSSLYTYLVIHGKPTRVTDTVFALVSLAIYFLCVKANFWKLLFLGDFILNYFVTVRGICFFLESRLFYDPSITYYSLRDESLLIISILLLLTLPLGLKFMKNATERVFQVDSSAFWQKVWFIPFSCTLIICAYNFDLNIDTVRKFRFILTRLWLFAMTILIYYVLLEALNAIRQQAQLEERAAQQDTLLAMQYTQYQQLSRHIEEVREARHDLRQHLNLIEHYLQSGKTEDLKAYIEQYRMTLPPDSAPFIRICAREDAGHIVIAVDNTCCHPPIEENGRFRSTKHDGLGTGTASIRSIAERYQGVADFRYEDGIFYASVMLKFDPKISHENP